MSDDEDRTARIERAVLGRIDRRAAARRGIVRGATAAVLLVAAVGGVAALHPLSGTGGSASGSAAREADRAASAPALAGGSSTTDGSNATAAPLKSWTAVRCHATSGADSTARVERAVDDPSAIAAACAAAFHRAAVPIVLCQSLYRGADLAGHPAEAYPADANPTSLCLRNGTRPVG